MLGAGDEIGGNAAQGGPVQESPYDLYQRGLKLMRTGSPAAAVQLLQRLVDLHPDSRSAREALARAQFRSGQYPRAQESFRWIAERDPSDDYAHFGLGLSAARAGDLELASGHLALAVALRPERDPYRRALEDVRGQREVHGRRGPSRDVSGQDQSGEDQARGARGARGDESRQDPSREAETGRERTGHERHEREDPAS